MKSTSGLTLALAAASIAQALAPPPLPEGIPDRASVEPDSRFHSTFGGRKVAVWRDGKQRPDDVVEYCVSEGWIRVAIRDARTGKPKLERGRPVTIKLAGAIQVRFR